MTLDKLKIPGFLEAVVSERFSRDSAFLDLVETVRGFQLRPMTLMDFMILRMARNPILDGEVPSPIQLSQFLWFMNPRYRPESKVRRWFFLRRCRSSFAGRRSAARLREAAKVLHGVRRYVAETLADRRRGTKGFQDSFYSDGIHYCARLARNYGWEERIVLNLPLRRLFQYANEIRLEEDPKAAVHNPSNDAVAKWQRELASKGPVDGDVKIIVVVDQDGRKRTVVG